VTEGSVDPENPKDAENPEEAGAAEGRKRKSRGRRDGKRRRPPEDVGDVVEQAETIAREADELAEALQEREQFKALLQRAQADLVNYRKRVQAEQAELKKSARRGVILRFLAVLDDFDTALDAPAAESVDAGWLEGVAGIKRRFTSILAAEGVERFDAEGSVFDPRFHEAMFKTPTAEHPADTVLRVLRCGYKQDGEVIRPAQVEIAAPPEGG